MPYPIFALLWLTTVIYFGCLPVDADALTPIAICTAVIGIIAWVYGYDPEKVKYVRVPRHSPPSIIKHGFGDQ